MSILFEEVRLNKLKLKNRFVRSATWDGMAGPKGRATPEMTNLLCGLAQGGVGLIVTGHAYVRPEGIASSNQLGIDDDSLVPGLAKMVREVHRSGGAVAMQLAHAGLRALTDLTKTPALAPSPQPDKDPDLCREMTVGEIQEAVRGFALAAKRAKEAGFDAVQIHAAHGYCLSQFLSPAYNFRTDQYGGRVENRSRFLLEAVGEVRSVVGPDFPVLVKINCRDFVENGLELEDSLKIGQALERAGVDALEISGGVLDSRKMGPSRTGLKTEDREAYFREEAAAFKKSLSIPVILVGGNRSLSLSERLVREGFCDLISMSRPFIRQPDLVNRWQAGESDRAACISDSLCFKAPRQKGYVYCLTREQQQKEKVES